MEAKQIPDVLAVSSSLRVIEIDPQTDLRWETLVASVPASSSPVYHPAWLKVLEEAYGYKPAHLACEDTTGQVVGILPLFYRRGWRRGQRLTSVFTGPLADDDQIRAALVQAAVERARAEPGAQLHLKVMSNAVDGLLEGVIGVPAYETYLLALPERAELLRLDSALKRAINKATRLGVQVRQAETERELRAWYGLYVQTMRRLVVLPKPYRFFELAWQHLYPRGLLRLLLAERIEAGRRRLLAGFLYLLGGQTISYVSAGWRQEDQALRPNDVLHWTAMQDACTAGLRYYDFGDVPLGNEGLARYKRKWGAQAQMVYDYSYPPTASVSAQAVPPHPARQLLQATWRHLPVKAIGLLSDLYYALHLY